MTSSIPHRLFLKLLVAFWLTFFVGLHGVWITVRYFTDPRDRFNDPSKTLPVDRTAMLAQTLESQGAAAARAEIESLPEDETDAYQIVTVEEDDPGQFVITYAQQSTQVTGADGATYIIARRWPINRAPYRKPGLFYIPFQVVLLGSVGGLLFAAPMAWYLTLPVRKLRDGFKQLADGDLSTRLLPTMGRRRDEIADLAKDFDDMADRLDELINSKERLLHEVSHELRSPLARIQVAVSLARLGPAKVDAALDRIEMDTARLDAMIGELLTLARAEHQSPRQKNILDLAGLLTSIVSDARFEATSAGISINGLPPADSPGPVLVKGNEELLRRAIGNVLRNAVQHTPQGGRIDVTMKQDPQERRAIIQICDTGPGVEPDRLRAIFEPFVRATNAGDVHGFGLGLSIAKRAIQTHGGTIAAFNVEEGGGLCVVMSLPLPENHSGDT